MTAKQIYTEIENYLPYGDVDFDGTCEGCFEIEGTPYYFECLVSLTITDNGVENEYETGTGYHDVTAHGEVWDTCVTEIENERVLDADIISQLEARIMERLNYWP